MSKTNCSRLLSPFLFILFFASVTLAQSNITLSGRVLDKSTNDPLSGATVHIKGTTHEVTTDERGHFNFLTGQKLPVTYVVSFVGYQTFEITQTKDALLSVLLQRENSQLNEVVVTGYSTQSKKTYTGAASQVKAVQLENRPAQSFDQLLGGQASGVSIIQPSGTLNSTPVFRIRGINSISSGIYPLIVVDGVVAFTGLVGGSVGNNPLADINPNDIESIDVLKDASATVIYGSRAANGVLVITTKKGKQGKTKVNYDGWVSFSKPYNLPELLNAKDYTLIKNEAMVNAGKPAGYALQTLADGSVVNTDWYDVAYHTGVSQNHNISFSGASASTKYFVSVGYSDQNGIVRNNEFKHKVARVNLDHQLLKRVTIGTHFAYSNSFNSGPNTGSLPGQYLSITALARATNILPPNVPIYKPDGSYNIEDASRIGYGANNNDASSPGYIGTLNVYNLQLILDKDNYTSENNSLLGDIYGEVSITNDLRFKTSYGVNQLNVENVFFQNPIHGDVPGGRAINSNSKYNRSDWINTFTFDKTFSAKHHLKLLAGYEEIYTTNNSWGATRTGVTDPFFETYQGGWTTIAPSNNVQGLNGFKSYFSNLGYEFDRRYLLSASFRRDGYSGLPEDNKYGNFFGGSVGWNISEENFFQQSSLSNTISFLKVRASYGQVGNINIGDFPSLGLYAPGTYAGTPTLGLSQAGNSNLKWETSNKTNIGFNVVFLNGKISLEADYYKNVIDELVLDSKQAPSRGIPNNSVSSNVGSMYNQGIELTLGAQILNTKNLHWSANINFSTLKNRVTDLSNGSDIYVASIFGIQNLTREGFSVGSVYAVPTTGVNPENGYRIFINKQGEEVQYNHAGTNRWTYVKGGTAAPAINNYTDGRIQGPSLPTYYGGLNSALTYGDFDVNVGFVFAGGNKLYNGTRANLTDQRYFNNGTFIKDRWTTPGQVTDVPKLIYGDNVSTGFTITNSAYVEDGSYVKLKNLAIGYRIPIQRITNNAITSARFYVQGSNLFTLTKYRGSDPESSINGNSIDSGKDHNTVVNATVYTFGLNLGF
ncbi:MAG TPA: SusC/RagA family TonB-linked outer membrane protein [Flavitalea sp.]|nr:SusC/RagA family TonB-linked outer membrane protein [Flavitalea sp.]